MPRIANQSFTLTRDDCRPLYFNAGDAIPAEYEDHWFVALHSDTVQDEVVEDDKPKVGRPKKS